MVHCSRENVQGKPPRIRNTHPIVYLGCGETLALLVERDGTVVLDIDDGVSTRRKEFSVSESHVERPEVVAVDNPNKVFLYMARNLGAEVDKED